MTLGVEILKSSPSADSTNGDFLQETFVSFECFREGHSIIVILRRMLILSPTRTLGKQHSLAASIRP